MELDTAFYIIAIIYMSLMFVLFIALFVAVLVIKAKINRLQNLVETRIDQAKSIATKATIGLKTIKYFLKMR